MSEPRGAALTAEHSRQLLMHAMVELLRRTSWSELSIRDICKRAGVARSTFYAHFQSKQDLLEAVLKAVASYGRKVIREAPASGGQLATVAWLVDYFASNRGSLQTVQDSAAGRRILASFREIAAELLGEELAARGGSYSGEALKFAAAGMFGGIEDWIESPGNRSQNELVRNLSTLVLAYRQQVPMGDHTPWD